MLPQHAAVELCFLCGDAVTGRLSDIQRPLRGCELGLPIESKYGIINPRNEPFVCPNWSDVNSQLVDYAKETTHGGKSQALVPLYDHPWNDLGPKRGAVEDDDTSKPLLRTL
ncbi:hypothetical protein AURDEDRAFT_173051 [Auricularia subglabra TFB-10046 SS5]|uniref:Uncharacterized protein n=1 Tax=Auricularia subglabra (strain TFB-10046 / SS5) TaxID=717982 RepID=J0WV21_AURST|nr:hypothetical protein AURDEDRAFT_173051 [Auricularia subglabra TFB-10046 SS5]